jgi:DNA N-6-adenine-methyltransferase (Dam)
MEAATLDFAARHSMDSPEWYTPAPFVEAARKVMGGIDLDPASHEEANRTVKAARFLTEEDDGLKQPWIAERIFLNPPGGKHDEGKASLVALFWRRLMHEWAAGHCNQAVWIGYSLEQLQTLQRVAFKSPLDFPICVTAKRIAFVENAAKKALRRAKVLAEGEKLGASEAKRRAAATVRAGKELPDSPSHSNYITYIGQHVDDFHRVFSQFGQVR